MPRQFEGPSYAKAFSWAVLEPALPGALGNNQDFWKWQNLGRNPANISSPIHSRSYLFNLISEHSITRVNLKFSCQNSYLFQSHLKIFIGHNFQSCWMLQLSKKDSLNCHIFGLSCVGMDSDQRNYVLLSSFGQKYQFSIWAATYFSQELSYLPSKRDRNYLNSFSYHLPSLSSQAIELVCLYKRENKPNVWKCKFLHSRAQLETGSELLVLIMSIWSTTILDRLENIRLRKESSNVWEVLVEHSCLKLLQHPKF